MISGCILTLSADYAVNKPINHRTSYLFSANYAVIKGSNLRIGQKQLNSALSILFTVVTQPWRQKADLECITLKWNSKFTGQKKMN